MPPYGSSQYWLESLNPFTSEHMREWGPVGLSPQGALLWHMTMSPSARAFWNNRALQNDWEVTPSVPPPPYEAPEHLPEHPSVPPELPSVPPIPPGHPAHPAYGAGMRGGRAVGNWVRSVHRRRRRNYW